jgi:hypothetical protein
MYTAKYSSSACWNDLGEDVRLRCHTSPPRPSRRKPARLAAQCLRLKLLAAALPPAPGAREGRRQPQIPPCLQPPQATTCLKTSPRGQRQTPTSNQAARRRLIELEPLLTRRRGGHFGRLHVRCHHRCSGRGRSNFDARSLKCSGDGSWCDGRAARVGCDGVVHNHLHSKQVRLSRRWTTTNAAAAARNMA